MVCHLCSVSVGLKCRAARRMINFIKWTSLLLLYFGTRNYLVFLIWQIILPFEMNYSHLKTNCHFQLI